MEKSEDKNFYELLGVERTASTDEIKQAFKDIVIVYHPDSNFFSEIVGDTSNSPEEIALFKKITEAYQTLINKDKRSDYDKELNKIDLAKGRQATTEWIRPDGSAAKDNLKSRPKQPTVTDLQKYQEQYRERLLQKSKTHSVAEIIEETHVEKKTNIFLLLFGLLIVVLVVVLLLIFVF